MTPTDDEIMDGLVAYVEQKAGSAFATYGRRVQGWTKMPDTDLPSLNFRLRGWDVSWRGEGLPITYILAEAFIYVKETDPNAIPESRLLAATNAFFDAMDPGPDDVQTLNGLVAHAQIEGKSPADPGELTKHGKAVFSLRIQRNPS